MVVPHNISNFRHELCRSCRTPCEYQNNVEYRSDGNNACPISRWGAYQLFVKVKPKMRGAGDVVAAFANPIAGAIDKLSGGKTKLKGCSACAKRREMLNQLLPFGS